MGPLLAAFFGNLAICVLKGIAALVSGSTAMMAETVHSMADVTNQVLLYVGLKRAQKGPDEKHPLGYGKESYFWAFLVSIGIFAGGSAFSIYHGIERLMNPATEIGSPMWSYFVLGGSILFEGIAFTVAFRQIKKEAGGDGLIASLRETREPILFTVLLEDSAAMIGLTVALLGVFLADYTGNQVYDASASIVIGVLLGIVAFFLARKIHSLLLGVGAHPRIKRAIDACLEESPEVITVTDLRTIQMGPDRVYVMVEALMDASGHGGEMARAVDAVEVQLRSLDSKIRHVYLEPQTQEGAALEEESE
jgi:cation diffusion facilitator family transporter